MVDKKKLNRVKRVLSAGNGAELPKYTVKPGDTLSQIVLNYNKTNNTNFTWQDVATWNSLADPNKIYPGQTLSFTNPQQPVTIPGADPSQGDPNALVVSAAQNNKQVNEQITTETTSSQVRQQMEPLPEISTKWLNGPTAEEKFEQDVKEWRQQQVESGEKIGKKLIRGQKASEITGQIATQALGAVGGIVGAQQEVTDSATTKTADALYDTAAGVVENLGPIGKVVGTAMKFAGMAGDAIQAMGGGTDQMTTMDKLMDSSFFSWNIGMLNGFAGKNSDSFAVDQDTLAQVGSSYGGTVDDLNDAAAKAGKKYGLFSSNARKKANSAIATAKGRQNLMGGIADDASDQRLAVQSMGEQAGLAYSIMTDGGYNQKYTYAAKQGGIIEWNPVITSEWEPQIELNWELSTFKEGGNIEIVESLEQIPELKSGGKTEEIDIPEIEETTQKNVIPEGALHKNKHHMEHAEGLTKKGIPVIDDDGEQQAEIEHSEIIFTLEVTKKLEEYYEIFYSEESSNKEKEQAAIDAGKLLVFQILENTEDRTGLIESCKQGGSLTLKKNTEDLIEEISEWMPSVTIIVESEEKPKKESKEKSEKEKMKEAIKEVLIELLTQ